MKKFEPMLLLARKSTRKERKWINAGERIDLDFFGNGNLMLSRQLKISF